MNKRLLLLTLALLSLPAVMAFFNGELTCGYDNVLHLWRAVETDALLHAGHLYSRWQPHMALGFGFPVQLFNPPLTPLLGAGLHRLGLTWPVAINWVFIIGTLLSIGTSCLLAWEWWPGLPGVIAGVIIGTLPFHAYVNFHRASMTEALAWGWMPLVLWGVLRWQRDGSRLGLLAASLGETLLLLSHDATAYLFFPFPLATITAFALAHRDWRVLWRGLLAYGLGIGMAAFFWLPSVLERGYVQFNRVLAYPYAASFVPLDYLLEPPRLPDPSFINPWQPKGIGLLAGVLIVFAVPTWWRAKRELKYWLGAVFLVTAGYIYLVTPYAHPVWQHSILPYLHFPWRFLTPAAVGVACLSAAGAHALISYRDTAPAFVRRGKTLLGYALLLIPLASLGWLYPKHCHLSHPPTLAGQLAYEQATGELGSTFFNELLPVWVHTIPHSDSLVADLNVGREPIRLPPDSLPAGAHILHADYRATSAVIELETPTSFRATYLTFYYPGWRVTIDGAQVPVVPTTPEGLLSFDMPEGRHTLRVRFAETPPRRLADAISVLAALGLIWLLAHVRPSVEPTPPPTSRSLTHWPTLLLSALVALLSVTGLLRRPNLVDGKLRHVDIATDITFGDEFILLGYDTLPRSAPSGERFKLRTYWRATQPGGPNYGVTAQVVDEQGHHWEDATGIRQTRWFRPPPPVGVWPPDQYALQALSVPLLPGTPPGSYTLELVAFDQDTLAALTAHDAAGRSLGPQFTLGTLSVTAPRCAPQAQSLSMQNRVDAPLGVITLLGADFDRPTASPGDRVLVTTFWQANRYPTSTLTACLRLLAPDGTPAATYHFAPANHYPTTAWRPGDLWRGQTFLRLPASLNSGTYRWTLGLGAETVPVGQIAVHAPARLWTPPPLDVTLNAPLGDVVTLLGANLSTSTLSPGDTFTVTLVWQARAEMTTGYRVFLHLLAPDGSLITQSDGEPSHWTRPTTGWMPGEVILDEHELTLPADAPHGLYRLQAGMYTLKDGRLSTPDGDAVQLLKISVK